MTNVVPFPQRQLSASELVDHLMAIVEDDTTAIVLASMSDSGMHVCAFGGLPEARKLSRLTVRALRRPRQ